MFVTVTTTMISAKNNSNIWFVMSVQEGSILDVYEALAEDGLLFGDRIYTDVRGARAIEREREEMIVGGNIIATIKPCHLEFEPSSNPKYVEAKTL